MQFLSPGRAGAEQRGASKSTANRTSPEGTRIFASRCAGCHGLDGRGAERGPDIANRAEIQRLSDSALLRIVRNGVQGTGMPSFRTLGDPGIQAVVEHLRNLQGQGKKIKLPGNPEQGKSLFFRETGCSQCHMVRGEGGFMGSDLSNYTSTRSVDEVRTAITDPNKNLDLRKRTVVVITTDGTKLIGIARNEDNFTLQLQTADGTFHFYKKSDLRNIEHQPQSLMPRDYGSRLSPKDLDDLVSYLMRVGQTSDQRKSTMHEEE